MEPEVLGEVMDRVLNRTYQGRLPEEVNKSLDRSSEDPTSEIARTERALVRASQAIEGLLHLAEGQGSSAAAQRLNTRGDEKAGLETRLRSLQARRQRGRLRVSDQALLDAVERSRVDFAQGSVRSRRRVLRTFV